MDAERAGKDGPIGQEDAATTALAGAAFESLPCAAYVVRKADGAVLAASLRAGLDVSASKSPEELLDIFTLFAPEARGALHDVLEGSGELRAGTWEASGEGRAGLRFAARDLKGAPGGLAVLLVHDLPGPESGLDSTISGPAGTGDTNLEAFIHGIVHDLRSPLVTVESMCTLLRDSTAGRLGDDDEAYLQHIESGTRMMRTLLSDLSELALIKPVAPPAQPVDPRRLLEALLVDLGTELAQAGATVELEGELPPVRADERLLREVFARLVSNAIKFHEAGSKPLVRISGARRGDSVELAVRDNGIGIAEDYRERIFGIFTKLHPRTRYGGNGIGLAIARRCVDAHGGRIWVEPAGDRGSVFRFRLPG